MIPTRPPPAITFMSVSRPSSLPLSIVNVENQLSDDVPIIRAPVFGYSVYFASSSYNSRSLSSS